MTNNSEKVKSLFILMTEKIANGKTNVLNFGSEDMTFYRGEIHMIKMIGDNPGIFSSEMARRFSITRAVVYKTLLKLEKREVIIKKEDSDDKKRYQLFLTSKGEEAYRLHKEYHEKHDKQWLDFLNELSENELNTIENFLKKSTDLIDNHF